jgi:hypothetical protein
MEMAADHDAFRKEACCSPKPPRARTATAGAIDRRMKWFESSFAPNGPDPMQKMPDDHRLDTLLQPAQ